MDLGEPAFVGPSLHVSTTSAPHGTPAHRFCPRHGHKPCAEHVMLDGASPPPKPESPKRLIKDAEKRLKRVTKARTRLLELVHPRAGDFPTLEEIDAFLAAQRETLEDLETQHGRGMKDGDRRKDSARGPEMRVCTEKACARRGSLQMVDVLESEPDGLNGVGVCPSKCMGLCKGDGVSIRISGEPAQKVLDVESARTIAVDASKDKVPAG